MSTKLTFGDRCELMFELANALSECAQHLERMSHQVRDEAERMATAQQRFAQQRRERAKADR
jgi:hypothetical protein